MYLQVFDMISGKFHGILHVFVNFEGFCGFTWILWLHNRAQYQKPWYYDLRHLHYKNFQLKICIWRLYYCLKLIAKRWLEDFFLFRALGQQFTSNMEPLMIIIIIILFIHRTWVPCGMLSPVNFKTYNRPCYSSISTILD